VAAAEKFARVMSVRRSIKRGSIVAEKSSDVLTFIKVGCSYKLKIFFLM